MGDAIQCLAGFNRVMRPPEPLNDGALAIVGRSHNEEVRHADALGKVQQFLAFGESSLRTRVTDPSIAPDAPDGRLGIFDGNVSRRRIQV
jgi:hypothetical protein